MTDQIISERYQVERTDSATAELLFELQASRGFHSHDEWEFIIGDEVAWAHNTDTGQMYRGLPGDINHLRGDAIHDRGVVGE